MKAKKAQKNHIQVAIPLATAKEFRTLCIMNDVKPSDQLRRIVKDWNEKEKKKQEKPALVANG